MYHPMGLSVLMCSTKRRNISTFNYTFGQISSITIRTRISYCIRLRNSNIRVFLRIKYKSKTESAQKSKLSEIAYNNQ